MLLQLFLVLFVWQTRCIQVINHIPGSSGVGVMAQPIHTTLVLTLARGPTHEKWTATVQERFLHALDITLQQDRCQLSFSAVALHQVVLKLSCPHTMDNSTETDDVPPLPHLPGFLARWQFEMPDIAVNRPVSHPSQWYGGGANLEVVMRNYKAGRAWSRPNYHDNAIQMPAPWGLDRIDMHFGLLNNEYQYNNVAQQVKAFIIDTGVRITHQEFQGRATFLANTVGDGVNTDCVGHGTHVASVIGGQTFGVAKQAQIYAVKVLDCTGNGDLFTISAGVAAVIEYQQSQPDDGSIGYVASMSLGGDFSSALNSAVLQLSQNGIATVVAAGNDGADACSFSPSALSSNSPVITVGASTNQDQRPTWSNYGACVSISAPGQAIIGAFAGSDTQTATLSGTSMATPFVSGVVALILQQNLTLSPGALKALVLAWVTPGAISKTSNTGGGENLLYSLVDVSAQPDFTAPTPTRPPPGSQPFPEDSAAGRPYTLNLLMILMSVILTMTLCG